jgi:rhodanese-related sulfurtransferase
MAVPRITKEELRDRLGGDSSAKPLLIDVRLKYPFEHSTVMLPGAIRMAPGALDPARLPKDRDVVLYDSDPDELVSEKAAADLIRLGFRAMALAGGISAWMVAKLPTESKPAPQPSVPAPGALKG